MDTVEAIIDPKEISEAYARLEKILETNDIIPDVYVGTPGGGDSFDIRMHKEHGFWHAFCPQWRGSGDLSILFGVGSPRRGDHVEPLVELNYYAKNPNKRMQGRYVVHPNDGVCVGHTGRLKKQRRTLSVSGWCPEWQQHMVEVKWPSRKKPNEQVIMLGALDDPFLIERIAVFLKDAHSLKHNLPKVPRIPIPLSRKQGILSFNPEFEGTSAFQRPGAKVIVDHEHGKVVNALRRTLEKMGYAIAKDQFRDVYIPATRNEAKVLFEVKKSGSLQDAYTAIGQLVFHAASQPIPPLRVLVVPDLPKPKTAVALESLAIKVVTYSRRAGGIRFNRLTQVLGSGTNATRPQMTTKTVKVAAIPQAKGANTC